MNADHCRRLYRKGYLTEAIEAARQVLAADVEQAREAIAGVQALMEMGRFGEAAEFGRTAAARCSGPEAAALRTQAAFAAMMFQPSASARAAVRAELQSLAKETDAFSKAAAKRWETRLRALEIFLFIRPLTQMPAVVAGFEEAAHLFQAAGCAEEARGELFRAAEQAGKGPPRDPAVARAILQRVRAEAGAEDDLPSVARAALALAELGFEERISGDAEPDDAALRKALAPFDEAMDRYQLAKMAAGEAEVRAAAGRKLMRYGIAAGADHLRAAAEIWEAAGHHGAADGAWRDLHMWHYHRADREEVEALEEKLCATPGIEGHLTGATSGVQLAQAALARGDFAEAVEISTAACQTDLEPGQAAALLLIKSAALDGRGARADAERAAAEAVALLRPAEPCTLLGDALFQLGCMQARPDERFRLWEEAARIDLACELNQSAAQRYANLAESLSQAGADAVLSDGRTVAALFQRAGDLTGDGRDLESLVLRGNIAQRRGLVAFRAGDFAECGRSLTEAENCFRRAGRAADLAFTLGHQGLVLLQIARRGHSLETFNAALEKFADAAALFRRQDLLGEQFRMERLAGAASWEAGGAAPEDARQALYETAGRHMAEAANLMELLRRGRQEKELFARQSSLDDIGALMEPFLEEAFRFHLNILQRPSEALVWLEKGKARGMLDALAAREFAPPPDLAPVLADEEHTLEAERRGIVDRNSYAARKRWKQVTARLERVWRTMAGQAGSAGYGALRLGLPMDWPRWQGALQEQQALPETAGRAVFSVHFAWPRNEVDPIRLIACRSDWAAPRTATVSTTPRSVESFVQQCFGGAGRSSLTAWLKVAGGDAAWCQRFAPLIAPLAEWTRPDDIVMLIPHGPLHSVPLHALHLEGQPLAERNAVCFAPSAAILMVCWHRQKRQPGGKSAVVGCPNPGAGFPPLPRAADEASYVARLLGGSPLVADRIGPEAFREAIADAWAVHFAGHATEAESGWDSGLQLGGGNVFSTRDFFQTRLNADIFTLSGCRTARSRRREGDEMLGLIPALLYAGASSVLASQWEAADDATAAMMRHFYAALHGPQPATKADAFRAAVIATRREFPTLPHWAAFTLHGDWK